MRDPQDIVIQPVITEKATRQMDEENVYTFLVRDGVNKIEIGRAVEKLNSAPHAEIIVTDTIPVTAPIERLHVLSVAELLGEALHRIHTNKSVSGLFHQ